MILFKGILINNRLKISYNYIKNGSFIIDLITLIACKN